MSPWRGVRVLVTGATGFIGSHVVSSLSAAGAEIHATTRRPRPSRGQIIWHELDLADTAALCSTADRVCPDTVIHLGGVVTGRVDPALLIPTFSTHLASSVALLSMTQRGSIGRLVLVGSDLEPSLLDAPTSPYAAAKAGVTSYARLCSTAFSTNVVTVRPADTYGPGQAPEKLLPYVADCALRGVAPRLSSGRRRADWIYIDDVTDGLLAAARFAPAGAEIDLGTGTLRTNREMVERLLDALGSDVEPLWGAVADRPGEPDSPMDAARTEQILGWRAAVPVEEGLRLLAESVSRSHLVAPTH